MAATIKIRGVCLGFGADRDGAPLVGNGGPVWFKTLFPATRNGGGAGAPRKHHPFVTVFDSGGQVVQSPAGPLTGANLRVLPGAALQAPPNLTGTFHLGLAVGPPHALRGPFDAGPGAPHLTMTILFGSGRVGTGTPSPSQFRLSKATPGGSDHASRQRDLEFVWTAPDNSPVAIESGGAVLATVGPDQVGVIGHFDEPRDRSSLGITPRPTPGGREDVDFQWLYQLIDPPVTSSAVPTLDETGGPGAGRGEPSLRPLTGPLTSTCFGGSWP